MYINSLEKILWLIWKILFIDLYSVCSCAVCVFVFFTMYMLYINNCDYCFQKDSYHLLDKEMKLELENVECECDSNLIRQLLIILLDNANRYTNSKDQVIVKLYKEKDECVIEVIDTGIGIGEEAIKHVFERFYREDKARSRETGGNGLGLSIARSIVKKHKGTIEASHTHPKGATFTVRLPL